MKQCHLTYVEHLRRRSNYYLVVCPNLQIARICHTPLLQMSVQLPHPLTLAIIEFILCTFILIEDIPFCFNTQNITNRLFCQEHSNSIWYWYLTMATFCGLSLDHLQTNVHWYMVHLLRTMYCGILYFLQVVREIIKNIKFFNVKMGRSVSTKLYMNIYNQIKRYYVALLKMYQIVWSLQRSSGSFFERL